MSNKWVEVEAKTIDDAIKAGLKELQLDDATEADISILREPEGGVFGVGGTKALVRISVRGGFKNRNGRNYKQRSRNDRPKNRKEKFEPIVAQCTPVGLCRFLYSTRQPFCSFLLYCLCTAFEFF